MSSPIDLPENKNAIARFARFTFSVIAGFYSAGVVFWVVAALVRLTVKDLSPLPIVTVLYYASPGVLLFLSAGLLSLFAGLLQRFRSAATWCLTAVIVAQCAGSHQGAQHHDSKLAPVEKTYRVLLWNVCHGDCGWKNIATELLQHKADVIALVEAGQPSEEMRSFWKSKFPGYDISLLGGEMILMTKGQSTAVRAKKIGRQGQLREIDLLLDGHEITAMIVDIHGRPDLPRGEALQDLAAVTASGKTQPILIAGDFNTPSESPLFQPLRQQTSNAFEVSGAGYSPTWPHPVPVLVLDQIWCNKKLHFKSCHNIWSEASDHCAVIAEFYFVP